MASARAASLVESFWAPIVLVMPVLALSPAAHLSCHMGSSSCAPYAVSAIVACGYLVIEPNPAMATPEVPPILILTSAISSSIDLHGNGVRTVLAGSALGAAEGLVFAWAGRSSGNADYAGASLIGAGLGAGLGIATATTTDLGTSKALTSTGFAAWGAWTGAFAGALASRDSHEVTLGGLGGANLGALLGYGLVKTDLVDPRDFGWLSLAPARSAPPSASAWALHCRARTIRAPPWPAWPLDHCLASPLEPCWYRACARPPRGNRPRQ
jgi:hypothetical protein